MSRANTNAKQEFLHNIDIENIKCVEITYNPSGLWEMYDEESPLSKSIFLKQNYSNQDLMNFLENLDFNYDSGFGGQELYGTIWLKDGTWYTRGEYDGSEWWQYHCCPTIPQQLK
jgi:hypothetical protein